MEKRIVFKGKRPAELPATISVVALMVFWICYFLGFDRTTPLGIFGSISSSESQPPLQEL